MYFDHANNYWVAAVSLGYKAGKRGLHVLVGTIFMFGSGVLGCALTWLRPLRLVFAWWLCVCPGQFPGVLPLPGGVSGVLACRGCGRARAVPAVASVASSLAAPAPDFRGQAFGGAVFVFFLPGVPACRMRWLRTVSRQVVAAASAVPGP